MALGACRLSSAACSLSTTSRLSISRRKLLVGHSQVGVPVSARRIALCRRTWHRPASTSTAFHEARIVLDSIDEVRQAVSKSADLTARVPCFAVVGMQSVGKSSVLQRLSGIELPRDANVCTRVPIELRMRRSDATEMKVKVAGADVNGADHDAVASAIKAAQDKILREEKKEFSETSVVVDVESSIHPNLTLIDLPGCFFASDTNKQEEIRLQALVENLMKSKIQQAHTLILHVVPLNQDSGTLNTWAIVNAADKDKQRTVCVLTKADRVENEEEFLSRLQNITKDNKEGNRCFLMDARPEKDEEQSLAEARQWLSGSSLKENVRMGHRILQVELEKVLVKHTLRALPSLKRDLQAEDRKCTEHLKKIGSRPPVPMEAFMGGIGAFRIDMRRHFTEQLGAIRMAIERMSTSVTSVNILSLRSMDVSETLNAKQFLREKCSGYKSSANSEIDKDVPLARALQVHCVFERHRGLRNIQFIDNSVLLEHWMPLFTEAIEPLLREFVKSIFCILKEEVAGHALKALARQHNGMLQRATDEILGPRVMDIITKLEDEAGVFCSDILSWNEFQFTSNAHYLQDSIKLSEQEEAWLISSTLPASAKLELEPLLVRAAEVRGFGKVQAKLLPDALQSQVVLLAHRAVEASFREVDKWSETALELVESEPEAIEKERANLRQRREMLQNALGKVSRIEAQYSLLGGVPSLSFADEGNTNRLEDGESGDGSSQSTQVGAGKAIGGDLSLPSPPPLHH